MAYNKEEPKALGASFISMIYAAADGLDFSDTAKLMDFIDKLKNSVDEFKEDPDSAAAYAISGASEAFGDRRSPTGGLSTP